VSTAKLPRPDEPRKDVAPEPAGTEHVPPGPEHRARNSVVVWVAVAVLLLAAGLSWIFRIGGNIVTFALMVIAVIFILLNVLGLRNPPG
jgi:hypothetical protein